MLKINMVILDNDTMFLNQFSRYLLDKTDRFAVSSFSDADDFNKYREYAKIDLILFSEFFENEISSLKATKILMTEGFIKENDKFYSVNKYQKAESFLKNIIMIYAEDTGNNSVILSSDKSSYTIGFYSPVGGSGKTTLALLTAKTFADNGARVLYLNLEKISSLAGIFNDGSGKGFSDILLVAKGNKDKLQLKILSSIIRDEASNIHYINPPESAVEYSEAGTGELLKIIHELKTINEFDYVIIDFAGEYSSAVYDFFDACSKIIFPVVSGDFAYQKLMMFLKEIKILGHENDVLKKTVFVLNRSKNEQENLDGLGIKNMSIGENAKYGDIRSILKSEEYNTDIGQLISLIRN